MLPCNGRYTGRLRASVCLRGLPGHRVYAAYRALLAPVKDNCRRMHTFHICFMGCVLSPDGSSEVPVDGFPWQPTRQPVVREAWPVTPVSFYLFSPSYLPCNLGVASGSREAARQAGEVGLRVAIQDFARWVCQRTPVWQTAKSLLSKDFPGVLPLCHRRAAPWQPATRRPCRIEPCPCCTRSSATGEPTAAGPLAVEASKRRPIRLRNSSSKSLPSLETITRPGTGIVADPLRPISFAAQSFHQLFI